MLKTPEFKFDELNGVTKVSEAMVPFKKLT